MQDVAAVAASLQCLDSSNAFRQPRGQAQFLLKQSPDPSGNLHRIQFVRGCEQQVSFAIVMAVNARPASHVEMRVTDLLLDEFPLFLHDDYQPQAA